MEMQALDEWHRVKITQNNADGVGEEVPSEENRNNTTILADDKDKEDQLHGSKRRVVLAVGELGPPENLNTSRV